MKTSLFRYFAIILFVSVLASCGNPPATTAAPAPTETQPEPTSTVVAASTPEPTSTPDPCLRPEIEKEIQEVHKHMREFDDASILASSVPRDQLSSSIADLQRIRRDADDEEIPICLANLKGIQVQHMNTVIETLLAFMRGTDQQTLDQGISLARQQHDEYTLELARMLGLTVVPATLPPAPSETPTP